MMGELLSHSTLLQYLSVSDWLQLLAWVFFSQPISYTVAAVFALHCALPICAAWYGMRGVPDMLAAKCKYTVLVPIATAVTWLAYLAADLLGLFALRNGWLPWWLKWASTHDEWLFGMHTQVDKEPMPVGWWQCYRSAVRWIRRNPAYHFAHHVCGYRLRNQVATTNKDVRSAALFVGGAPVQGFSVADRDAGLQARAPWGNAFFVNVYLNLGFKTVRIGAGSKLWRNAPDAQGSSDPRAGDPDGVCMMATKITFVK